MIAMDLPGRYQITSLDRNNNIFIMYDLDSEYIKPVAIKSRKIYEILRFFGVSCDCFNKAGFTARSIQLYNKVSKRLINCIETERFD